MKSKADFCFVRGKESGNCPICGEPLRVRGERKRKIKDEEGEKRTLIIRRMKCVKCRKIHHELPDCVIPYKRYSAEAVEAVISGGKKAEVVCEDGTIRRLIQWWRLMLPYYINVTKTLTEKYQIQFHEPPLLKEIIRAVVNSNNWICSKIICTRTELSTA